MGERGERERETYRKKLSPKAQPGLLTEQRIERIPKETASWLQTSPPPRPTPPTPPAAPTSNRQSLKARGNLGPRDGQTVSHQTVNGLPVANQVFLGSWMVDTCQEGRSLRSAHQRRHTAYLRWCLCGAPRIPSGRD